MGQFKPMVKMMTTEPTVELKLKKGGHVSMKHGGGKHGHKMMDGGVMSALAGAPAPVGSRGGLPAAARPAKPSMATRRRAMMGRPMMAEGGETKATHKAEMKKMSGLEKELKSHESKPASKAHKGLKTGGVVMGQGGFKKGGAVPKSGILPVAESERGAQGYKNTKMHTAEGEDRTPKKTGEVVMGKPGGYKKGGKAAGGCYAKGGGVEGNVSTSKPGKTNTTTGEVKKGNAGGYKKGGVPKKSVKGSGAKAAARYADGGDAGFLPAYQRGSYKGMSDAPSMESQFGGTPSSGPYAAIEDAFKRQVPSRGFEPDEPYPADYFDGRVVPDILPPKPPSEVFPADYFDGPVVPYIPPPRLPSDYYSSEDRSGGLFEPISNFVRDKFKDEFFETSPYPVNRARIPELPYKRPYGMATGGAVNDAGRPVAYPKKAASASVKNNLQSGTFRKGGKVKMAEGGKLEDLSKGAYDKSIGPSEAEMDIARTIRGIPRKIYEGAKRMVGVEEAPKAGSVTRTEKSVTVTPAKRRGGSVKR